MSRHRSLVTMESLEEVAAREEAERQQSLRDLEQLYEWLQQFEDPPPAPRPPPPYQFRNDVIEALKIQSPGCPRHCIST
nr:unnamed protein product [Callosobruchus chinensis]